jgi:branched-chain amino acid transport system permease protein
MSRAQLEVIGRAVWVPVVLCFLLWLTWTVGVNVLGSEYIGITLNLLITVTLVIGLQVFSGNSGILSFGHIAFMALGAYSSALLTIPPEIKKVTFTSMPGFLHWILDVQLGTVTSTLVAGAFAAAFGLIIATPIVRLTGVPAGIATLAILVIVYTFNIQTTSITRGTSTMIGVPSTTTAESALAWACVAVIAAFLYQASRSGVRLRGSRENEAAARSVGVNVPLERGKAWVLSAFIMGVGGALYGHYIIAFSAGEFYFDITFLIVLMLVIGGLTSVSGAVVGAIFIGIVREALRRIENGPLGGDLPGFSELVLAAVLVIVLILRPRGLTAGREIPWIGDWRPRAWLPLLLGRGGPEEANVPAGTSTGDASGTGALPTTSHVERP